MRNRALAVPSKRPVRVAAIVRQRIEGEAERVWRLEDFRDLPFNAVAKTLSRLARAGQIQRLSKGVYYRPRETSLGKSRPSPVTLRELASARRPVFSAGLSAASLLGFTTQVGRRAEISTSRPSLPMKLIGKDTIVHRLRPSSWDMLSQTDAALLEFLRARGRGSELSPDRTVERLLALVAETGRFEAMLEVADSEPPRVRAMLGAIGQNLGKPERKLSHLRASLNPFSRFDFGLLSGLPHAHEWQAKLR